MCLKETLSFIVSFLMLQEKTTTGRQNKTKQFWETLVLSRNISVTVTVHTKMKIEVKQARTS